MALAGLDFRPFLRASDPAERLVEMVVAEQVSDALSNRREVERKNLAIEIGSIVNEGLARLARAMR